MPWEPHNFSGLRFPHDVLQAAPPVEPIARFNSNHTAQCAVGGNGPRPLATRIHAAGGGAISQTKAARLRDVAGAVEAAFDEQRLARADH